MPTLIQGFSRSPRYLTTRFHHLRTVEHFVLDHVLQRADALYQPFLFQVRPVPLYRSYSHLNFVPVSRTYLPFLFLILHFHPLH
jgi:hypothetical protein